MVAAQTREENTVMIARQPTFDAVQWSLTSYTLGCPTSPSSIVVVVVR